MAGTVPEAPMRSEIRRIRTVAKAGAYGDPDKVGFYVYGTRPDGRTVPCNHKVRPDGSVVVWSTWRSPECERGEVVECASEFTSAEWSEITEGVLDLESYRCEQILKRRACR